MRFWPESSSAPDDFRRPHWNAYNCAYSLAIISHTVGLLTGHVIFHMMWMHDGKEVTGKNVLKIFRQDFPVG